MEHKVPDGALVEVVVSDGDWTIGYINGMGASWEGNTEFHPSEFREAMEEEEFHDGNGIWMFLNGRWQEWVES
jgi:hypothetical protein